MKKGNRSKWIGTVAEFQQWINERPEADTSITKVIFRKFPKEKPSDRTDIIAFFPGIEDTWLGNHLIQSYTHIGQHSQADPELIHVLSRCTYTEYEPLLKELESIGYNLYVLSDYEASKIFEE